MRMAWLVFFLMTALTASLGALLLDQSASTTTNMLQSSESLKEQLRQQDEKLHTAQTKLHEISQQLTQMEEAASKPAAISEQIQTQLKEDREKQAQLQKEAARLIKWKEKNNAEKLRIQTEQSQIDAAKRQLEIDEKLVDLDILTAIVESRVQKKIQASAQSVNAANPKPAPEPAAPMKGADQFGEAPYVPAAAAPVTVQVAHTDSKAGSEVLARKNMLTEEKKKWLAKQQQLNSDKKKLAQSQALYEKQQLAYVQAVKSSQLTTP